MVHASQAVLSNGKSMASAQRPSIPISTTWADRFRETGYTHRESPKSILSSGQQGFLRETLTDTRASDLLESSTTENKEDSNQLHGLENSVSPISEVSSTHTITEPSPPLPLLDPASAQTIDSADLEFSFLGPSLTHAINLTANMDPTDHSKNLERILLDLKRSN